MKKITQHKLDKILDKHERWVRQDEEYPGERAVLSHHELRGLDLSQVDFKSPHSFNLVLNNK